jgi:hypothetical protein
MVHGNRRLIWAGRFIFALVVAATAIYLSAVGLDSADKLGSGIGVVIALCSLGAPYLVPPASGPSAPAPGSTCASGIGAVAVGGSNSGKIRTEISAAMQFTATPPAGFRVEAGDTGSVAVAGDNTGSIHAKVTGSAS